MSPLEDGAHNCSCASHCGKVGEAFAQLKAAECLVPTQALHGALWALGSGGFLRRDEHLSMQNPFHPNSLFLGQAGGQPLVLAPLTVPGAVAGGQQEDGQLQDPHLGHWPC